MADDIRRLTVRMTEQDHRALRVTCEALDLSMQDVAARLLDEWVVEQREMVRARVEVVLAGDPSP